MSYSLKYSKKFTILHRALIFGFISSYLLLVPQYSFASISVADRLLVAIPKRPQTKFSFTYTGANQTFTVPSGITSINIKAWGAGGGGGRLYTFGTVPGAGGGYSSGNLSVTSGQILTVIVGRGGLASTTSFNVGYGGGGGVPCPQGGNGGGGRSAVRNASAVELITAGGGGGGSVSTNYETGYSPGGGSSGGTPGNVNQSGKPGTQSAGGLHSASNGATDGTQYTGGNGNTSSATGCPSAGGGGGYYGGGGANVGCGGGGSGYIGGVTSGITTAGSTTTPPQTGDADYVSGVGYGNASGAGGNGLVVITTL